MGMKTVRRKCLLITICLLLSVVFLQAEKADAQASLAISPSVKNASFYSNPTFTVYVSVSNVSNLYGYQYDIQYDQSILNFSQWAEEPFLKSGAQTLCVPANTSVQGVVKNIACTRTGSTSASGTGSITSLVFSINSSAAPPFTTQIRIVNSKLSDINSQAIAHTIANGTINIKSTRCGDLVCDPDTEETCSSCPQDCGQCPCPSGQTRCSDGVCRTDCGGGGGDGGGGGGGSGLICTNNQTRSCSLSHSGRCASGTETCVNENWTGCPTSSSEICNHIDDDCNGVTDNGLVCECFIGDTRPCGSNVGECREGTAQCLGGAWGECAGNIKPSSELCNGKDDDCDSVMDNNCTAVTSVCQDGLIPEEGCICGDKFYTIGFCYGGVYSETGPQEFPWIIVTIFGVMVILLLTAIIIYKEFHRKGKTEITWKELLQKYKSSFYGLKPDRGL